MKVCNVCKVSKPLLDFAKDKTRADGLHSRCRVCGAQSCKQYREGNKDKLAEYKKQYYKANKEKVAQSQKQYKEVNKDKVAQSNKQYKEANKDKVAQSNKQYYEANKEKVAQSQKQYREANKDKVAQSNKQYMRNRRMEDPLFKFKDGIRNLIGNAIRKKGFSKTSSTFDILDAPQEVVRSHLESQFTEGMSWDNRGDWHIDHFIPVSYAKNDEEVLILNHYRNLQPLWATQNLTKSDSLPSIEEIRARGLEDIWEAVNCGY